MHKHNDLKRHSLAIIMAIAISLMTVSFFDGLSSTVPPCYIWLIS